MKTTKPRKPGTSPKAQRSSVRPSSNRRRPFVLVVDDQQCVLETLRVLLEAKAGCRVITAGTNEEAVELAQRQHIDVAISDLGRVASRDGFEFLKTFKRTHPEVPVIIHSATVAGAREQRALHLGAFKCLLKPCSAGEITEAVQQALVHRRRVLASHKSEKRPRCPK